ncbi:hypothetical protein LTH96_03090 [Nesterenkonia sp. LB17]|uniref:hypothetical protein n=1 Tax=Nesterenkonia sp. LB17 TaxID=2901230 RepID=UPI001F4C82A8|nr:hypothetical protein [Nesterenkonia sp. LB17]MCH8564730.1 hypothetical protein [Nesterenkonia sp. LB17]
MTGALDRETLATAYIAEGSMTRAAQIAGVSLSTASRRLNEPETLEIIRDARRGLLTKVLSTLEVHVLKSVATLAEIQNDQAAPSTARVQAANSILSRVESLAEQLEVQERLTVLEDALKATRAPSTRRGGEVIP